MQQRLMIQFGVAYPPQAREAINEIATGQRGKLIPLQCPEKTWDLVVFIGYCHLLPDTFHDLTIYYLIHCMIIPDKLLADNYSLSTG